MPSAFPLSLLSDAATVDEDGRLSVGGCRLGDLAAEHGTPLFVYDEEHLRSRCREVVRAFGDRAVYASKAFLCPAMAELVHQEGMRLDATSIGEITAIVRGGVPAVRIVLHGNNRSRAELAYALTVGVRDIVLDCWEDIDRIEGLVTDGHPAPRVMVRVNPGVTVNTHEFIQTGQHDSKFGFGMVEGEAERALSRAAASSAMEVTGLHFHLGSQILSLESFGEALAAVAPFVKRFALPELSLGGGLGVRHVVAEIAPTIDAWADYLLSTVAALGIDAAVTVEPGRSIAATAAITIYEVGSVKAIPGGRTFVAVDGGFIDNPRPALYGSDYDLVLPDRVRAERDATITLVGKHCESGDVLVRNGAVPADLAVGELIATPATGAYGFSMASNYNMLSRPAVVFARDGVARLVVRRETVDDFLAAHLDP